MENYSDRIKPIDYGIHTYLENLIKRNYQIPTFQRNVVWDEQNVKKCVLLQTELEFSSECVSYK